MVAFGKMLRRHWDGIMRWFETQQANAILEEMNSGWIESILSGTGQILLFNGQSGAHSPPGSPQAAAMTWHISRIPKKLMYMRSQVMKGS
jgi:hypothetical protein